MNSKTPKNDELGRGNIRKLFFKISIPAVVAQLVNLLYNLIDRIYIGHLGDGKTALTGLGVCLPIIVFISAFSSLCGMGGAPKAAIKMGEGDNKTAEKILGNCFSLSIIFSIILTIVFSIFGRNMLFAFGASEDTIVYAWPYLRIYTLGTIFVMLSLGMNMFITTQGFSKISMRNIVIGAILNIALDPLFIFVFKMGATGAALATIISQGISSILVVIFLTSKKTILKLKFKNFILDIRIVLSCLALGISPFIMTSTESILSICFNTSLHNYGGDLAVGAMTILTSIMNFAVLILHGFTQGAQPIISYNYGAKNKERVKQSFMILLKTCVIYSFIIWICALLIPKVLVSIFSTDTELIEYSSKVLRIYMAVIVLFGIQVACQQTFISIGNAICSLFLALLRKVILLIPLIYILPCFASTSENKCLMVFTAEPIADFLAVTTTLTMFIIVFRKSLNRLNKN